MQNSQPVKYLLGIFFPSLNEKGLCEHDVVLHVGYMTHEVTGDNIEPIPRNPLLPGTLTKHACFAPKTGVLFQECLPPYS